eukprot:434173-Pleurochrysis_carterae.AAC.1
MICPAVRALCLGFVFAARDGRRLPTPSSVSSSAKRGGAGLQGCVQAIGISRRRLRFEKISVLGVVNSREVRQALRSSPFAS